MSWKGIYFWLVRRLRLYMRRDPNPRKFPGRRWVAHVVSDVSIIAGQQRRMGAAAMCDVLVMSQRAVCGFGNGRSHIIVPHRGHFCERGLRDNYLRASARIDSCMPSLLNFQPTSTNRFFSSVNNQAIDERARSEKEFLLKTSFLLPIVDAAHWMKGASHDFITQYFCS